MGLSVKQNWEKIRKRVLPRRRKSGKPSGLQTAPPVVLIHGLAVSRHILMLLEWRLRRRYGRLTYNFPFSTWKYDLPDSADALSRQLAEWGLREFDAVTSSAGAIVLRWAMNHRPMPRLRRAVLVAPPNGGTFIASRLSKKLGPLFPLCWGEMGMQLRRGDSGLAAMAGRLPYTTEVGIIAGGSGTPGGKRNIFGIPGDNDGTVAVEETILAGMQDFVLLNADHTWLNFSPQTAHMANLFLEHGVFRPPTGNPPADEKH